MEPQPGSSRLPLKNSNLPEKPLLRRAGFTSEEKDMVINMYNYVRETWPADDCRKNSTSLHKKTASVLGIGVASVYRILKEFATNKKLKSALKTKKRPKFAEKIDEFDKSIIRKRVHDLYQKGELPTAKYLLQVVNSDQRLPNFKRSTFQKIIKHLKFKFIRCQTKSILTDRDDVIIKRRKYLEKIKAIRRQDRRVFYLDELWVNTVHTVSLDPLALEARTGAKTPRSRGKTAIVVHIGNENGFLPGAQDFFEPKITSDDRQSIDPTHFERWFENILPKLGERAVVVMDNASHHSRHKEKVPNIEWKKADIQEWLKNRNVTYDEDNVKAQLLKKVNDVKKMYKAYTVDEIARKYKVDVLRLPIYHGELNPIELIWAEVKGHVARNNTTSEYDDVKRLIDEGIQNISAEKWRNCVDHVIDREENFYSNIDDKIDSGVESVIVNATHSDYSEDTYSDDTDDDN